MKFFFLLILAIGFSFAASCLDVQNATQTVLDPADGQGPLIAAVISLTVVLIAVAYALGKSTGDANYVVFAKDELYHLGFSVVLLLFIGGILVSSCLFTDFFYLSLIENIEVDENCFAGNPGMNAVAECYINIAEKDAKNLAEHYVEKYIDELMSSTFSFSVQFPLVDTYTSTAGAYRRIVSNQYDIILNTFIIPALMSISMQKLALNFINENLIRWMLPTAFFLRIFIPTRQIGNIFIAIIIGLYVVVPFMYVFNWTMYDVLGDDCERYETALYDNVVDGFNGLNTCSETNPYGFWAVARLIPQAFFLPNLTIAMLIVFLTSANKALKAIG